MAFTVSDLMIETLKNAGVRRVYASPYGDGRASERVVAALLDHRGLGPRPVEFAGAASSWTAADEVVVLR